MNPKNENLIEISKHWNTVFSGKIFSGNICLADNSGEHPLTGTTRLLRRPKFQIPFTNQLIKINRPVRILIVPGSIGLEAYTMAIIAANTDEHHTNLCIDTLDISQTFSWLSEQAVYPSVFLENQESEIQKHFQESANGQFRYLSPNIRSTVRVLPAQNIFQFEPEEPYDAVICQNLIQYLNPVLTRALLLRLSKMTARYLCFDFAKDLEDDYLGFKLFAEVQKHLKDKGFALLDEDWNKHKTQNALPETQKEKASCWYRQGVAVLEMCN